MVPIEPEIIFWIASSSRFNHRLTGANDCPLGFVMSAVKISDYTGAAALLDDLPIGPPPRPRERPPLPDADLVADMRALVAGLPTYGCRRRVHTLLRDVRDLVVATVEHRYRQVHRVPEPIEWMTDNGSCYTSCDTRGFARDAG
jgi:hypothetical protein